MTDKPKRKRNPKKPVWDAAQPGPLPEPLADAFADSAKLAAKQEDEQRLLESLTHEQRLARLDEMQAEAIGLANSRGAEFMTDEQRFINTWTREATVAAASLHVFQNKDNQVENRESKITDCRRRLAVALCKLGRVSDALMLAQSFFDLLEHIQKTQAAKELSDDEFLNHPCARPLGEQDGKAIELDRRWNSEEVISEIHGGLVKVWTCQVCGLANAVPDTPERQSRYDATMHATIHKAAKGDKPNAKGIAATARQFEAATLLAKQE
jgi:hypothetical protein